MEPRSTGSIQHVADEPGSRIHGYVGGQQWDAANGVGHGDFLGRMDAPQTDGRDGGQESGSTEVTHQIGDE